MCDCANGRTACSSGGRRLKVKASDNREVETLTNSLPMAIFSSAPFATPFSPVIKLCIPNAFNKVGVKSLHTKKSYALFGFGELF